MKDEDFDDLGKRLYDLEADPPHDGWEKLRPVVAITPVGKVGWLRKNAWKSMLIVVPVLFFSVYYISSSEEEPDSMIVAQGVEIGKKEESMQSANKTKVEHAQSSQTDIEKPTRIDSNSVIASLKKENGSNEMGLNKLLGIATKESKEPVFKQRNAQSLDYQENDTQDFVVSVREKSGAKEESDNLKSERIVDSTFALNVNPIAEDSTVRVVEVPFEEESGGSEPILTSVEDKKGKTIRAWRISGVFTPAYQTNPATPVANDDVYVTDVDNATRFKKSGYGLAFGIGRNLSPDFYLDAQFSYTKVKQDIYYTFATGKIDTLLAIQQADNSVLVKPVYETMDRELTSIHHFGGLRLMATYYFWARPKSRFNLSAAVGAHYLIASTLEENKSGELHEIPSEPTGRINYSFMVGAGYNVKVKHGWEFTINPTLSYFLSEVKLKNVPYSLNQQSVGINLMVSKTLFKRG